MKVGVFCDSFFPENKAVAIRLFHIVEAFTNCPDVDVTVHTSTRDAAASNRKVRIRKNIFNASSNIASNGERLATELILGMEMFFRTLFSNCDLLLFTSPPFFSSFLGAVAAKLRKIPYIFDVRDEYPEVFFTSGILRADSIVGKCLSAIEKFIYRNAFKVITVTEGICQRIDRKVQRKDFALLVRNGFDGHLFKPQKEKNEQFTVVFHGNLGKFQDPSLIVSLAKKTSDVPNPIHFKIIGFGNNDQDLKNSTLSNLEFLGMVDYMEIPAIISRAHVGISFRTNDTISQNSFPVKLYEYLGVAIPVIITPISEAGHFFESHQIGFQFNPDDEDRILSKIIELSNAHDELQKITDRILSLRESFSRQQISHSFVSLMVNTLKDRKKWEKY